MESVAAEPARRTCVARAVTGNTWADPEKASLMADVSRADAVADVAADPAKRTAVDRIAEALTEAAALAATAESDCMVAADAAVTDALAARRTWVANADADSAGALRLADSLTSVERAAELATDTGSEAVSLIDAVRADDAKAEADAAAAKRIDVDTAPVDATLCAMAADRTTAVVTPAAAETVAEADPARPLGVVVRADAWEAAAEALAARRIAVLAETLDATAADSDAARGMAVEIAVVAETAALTLAAKRICAVSAPA